VTAVIALVFKAIIIPVALHRIVKQLGIHRDIETAVGIGPTMLAGMGLVAPCQRCGCRLAHGSRRTAPRRGSCESTPLGAIRRRRVSCWLVGGEGGGFLEHRRLVDEVESFRHVTDDAGLPLLKEGFPRFGRISGG